MTALVAVGLVIALALDGGDDQSPAGGDGTGATDDPADLDATGPMGVSGAALPQQGTGADGAIGMTAPVLEGIAPDGTPVRVGSGEPTLVVFLAHWCPHCQVELPRLVDLATAGGFDQIRAVAILTGTRAEAPNYPPAPWLIREGWAGEVLLDDAPGSAAAAYGLDAYPYLVMLDASGRVLARRSGEVPSTEVQAMIDLAVATSAANAPG
jgi:thiol-disulfide isomerase/thioredoxin